MYEGPDFLIKRERESSNWSHLMSLALQEMTPYGFYIVKILILEVSENKAAKQILNNSKQSE